LVVGQEHMSSVSAFSWLESVLRVHFSHLKVETVGCLTRREQQACKQNSTYSCRAWE